MARMNGDFTGVNKSRTADPRLREAVARLCGVRLYSPGAITAMCRLDRYTDQRDYEVHQEKERENKIRASNELAASRYFCDADPPPPREIFLPFVLGYIPPYIKFVKSLI